MEDHPALEARRHLMHLDVEDRHLELELVVLFQGLEATPQLQHHLLVGDVVVTLVVTPHLALRLNP